MITTLSLPSDDFSLSFQPFQEMLPFLTSFKQLLTSSLCSRVTVDISFVFPSLRQNFSNDWVFLLFSSWVLILPSAFCSSSFQLPINCHLTTESAHNLIALIAWLHRQWTYTWVCKVSRLPSLESIRRTSEHATCHLAKKKSCTMLQNWVNWIQLVCVQVLPSLLIAHWPNL